MSVSLRFGVFPLGLAGSPAGVASGPPDDFGQIERAFVRLQGDGPQQADALETVLRAVHARRDELNVTHWELFTLRDADSSSDDMFHQFGVLRDDYTPKPAFERLRSLFAELSRPDPA
jgi:hypothetical protein